MVRSTWIVIWTSKVTKSERRLEEFVTSGELSLSGKAAVIAALDPFHDERISDLEGWPDMKVDPSVVRCVKKSLTISPMEADGPLVIYTLPLMNDVTMDVAYRDNNFIKGIAGTVATGFTGHYGGTYVQQYKASDVGNLVNLRADSASLAPDDEYLKGECRIIGWGVEVHDVTPPLYKGGTLTVCEIPQPSLELSSWVMNANIDGIVNNLTTTFDASWMHGHPTSLGEAMLTPGARQWDAAQGCYTVVSLQGKDNNATYPQYVQPLLGYKADSDRIGMNNTDDIGLGRFQMITKGLPAVSYSNRFAPFNSKCIILTGLQPQASFTINATYFVETFPGVRSDLVTLAQPSAAFDPVALRMISEGTRKLPVGVPVSENGLGDWFAEVVADIAPFAAALLTGFAPEFAPLALGAGQLANAYRKKQVRSPKQAQALAVKAAGNPQRLAPPNSTGKPKLAANPKPRKRKNNKGKGKAADQWTSGGYMPK